MTLTATTTEPPYLQSRQALVWRRDIGFATVGVLASLAVLLYMRDRLPDDAYITLSYARNLAEHGHWGLIEARTANTATSPLNVWLLAAGIVVTGSPVAAVGGVLALAFGGLAVWVAQVSRAVGGRDWVAALAAVGLAASSPLLLSTVGLESYLGLAVIAGVARYAVAGRWLPLGLVAGLAVLTRPDLTVIAVVLVLLLPAARTRWWRAGLVAAAMALPWHLWAWFMLGGFVPDTLLFKAADRGGWEGHGFVSGPLLYLDHFPAATALAAATAALGALCTTYLAVIGGAARQAVLALAAAGVAHFLAFAAIGTAPYGWYFAPSVAALLIAAAVALSTAKYAAAGLALPALLAAASVGFLAHRQDDGLGPIVYNYGTAAQYAQLGTELGAITGPSAPIRDGIEIGTVAYFCRCTILEQFTDPAAADVTIDKRAATAGPVLRWLIAVNGLHRERLPQQQPAWVLGFSSEPDYTARWVIQVPARGGHFLQLSPASTTG